MSKKRVQYRQDDTFRVISRRGSMFIVIMGWTSLYHWRAIHGE